MRASEALRHFAVVAGEFEEWLAARAYMTGDGPRVIFADATGWLRGQQVLLPGVTTLARLVARARSDGDRRLWEALAAVPTGLGLVELPPAALILGQGSGRRGGGLVLGHFAAERWQVPARATPPTFTRS